MALTILVAFQPAGEKLGGAVALALIAGGARGAPAASAATGSRLARGAAGHEGAGKRRGLLAILVEGGLKPGERSITLGQADRVDRQVVHETGVEHVRGVAAAAHARGRFLGHAQEGAE